MHHVAVAVSITVFATTATTLQTTSVIQLNAAVFTDYHGSLTDSFIV